MRRALGLACVVIAGSIVHAQQPTPPVMTFRASVHLIVQPVSVKDRQGRPVEGLTAKDFVVTEDGRPQQIAFVEFQRLAADAPSTPAIAPSTVEPVTRPDLPAVPLPGDVRYRGRRLLVFYFDLFGMPFFDQGRVFQAGRRYISAHMTPADLVAIMVFEGRGPRLRLDFSGDRDALLETIRKLETEADERDSGMPVNWDPGGGAFGDDDETFNLFTADRQLAALQTAVAGFAALPELKTLVYFGSGLRANGAENMAQLRATVNAAVRANVTLNPVDARGLVATAPLGDATRPSPGGVGMFSGAIAQAATTRFQQSQDTLYALAKDTGGTASFDINDLSLGIVKAAQAVTGYYLIGYYTDNVLADGRYRRVKVTVNTGMAVDVSARPGYYGNKVFEKFNATDRERQLADALRLEDPVTEIPMAMEVNYFQLNAAEYFVPVSVRMPGSELTAARRAGAARVNVDMIGELKDEFGVTQRNVRDIVALPSNARAIQYETAFTILPGRYVLKVLARNNSTGRIGTFQTAFTVPNLDRERERLPTSSVVLTAQRVAAGDAVFSVKQKVDSDSVNPLVHDGRKLVPSVTRTFSARQPLFVFVEAYERSAARPLVAYAAFYRDGVKVFETEPEGVTTSPASSSGAVPIRLQIPLARLTPGRYECQVSVLDPSGGRAAFWRAPIAVVR